MSEDSLSSKEHNFTLVEHGDVEALQLQTCDFIGDRDYRGNSYLHRAVSTERCNIPMLHLILSQAPQLAHVRNVYGKTALCLACKNLQQLEVIKILLEANPEVINLPDNDGLTPLYHLFLYEIPSQNVLQNAKFLISNGADVNAENNSGVSILQALLPKFAFQLDKEMKEHWLLKLSLLQLLVNNEVKVRSSSGNAWSEVTNVHEAKILLKVDQSNLNLVDKEGKTSLHLVLENHKNHEKMQVVKYLIEQGAELEPQVDMCALVIEREIYYEKMEIIKILFKKYPPEDEITKDKSGKVWVLAYFCNSNIDSLTLFLTRGKNPKIYSEYPLSITGKPETVWKLLLEYNVDPLDYETIDFSFVSNIIQRCATDHINFQEWLNILKYILNLPQINENTSELKKREIYEGILEYIFQVGDVYEHYRDHEKVENLQKLLMSVYEVNNDIVSMIFYHTLPSQKCLYLTTTRMFGILSHAMATAMECYDYRGIKCMIAPFLHNICNVLFSIPNFEIEQEGCLSPLTVFVLSTYTISTDLEVEDRNWDGMSEMIYNNYDYVVHDEEEVKERFEFFKLLIDKGCDINAMDLEICMNTMNGLKQSLQVPDALLVSLMVNNKQYVEVLIQHWWRPPLALLLLCGRFIDLVFWLPFLMQYHAIPCGTDMYQALKTHMRTFEVEFLSTSDESRNMWLQYLLVGNNQPASLQSICKYTIRQHLSVKVTRDTTLPALLSHSSIPPLLRAVLLH